jgi:hypothetical protein
VVKGEGEARSNLQQKDVYSPEEALVEHNNYLIHVIFSLRNDAMNLLPFYWDVIIQKVPRE